jgi:hypothetical protein
MHWPIWVLNPCRGRGFTFVQNVQTSSGTTILLFSGCWESCWRREEQYSGWGMELTAHFHQVSRLKMSSAILLLSWYSLMIWKGQLWLYLLRWLCMSDFCQICHQAKHKNIKMHWKCSVTSGWGRGELSILTSLWTVNSVCNIFKIYITKMD